MQERRNIVISEDVIEYLASLSFLLFKNGYFDYFENALDYVDTIYDSILSKIFTAKHITVKDQHKSFGDYYFVIKSNRKTAWHIYFIKEGESFYITKIANNHLPFAKYLNNE